MTLKVKLIGDRILVEAVEEKELKKGGIIIPDTAKEKPMESRIVALGTGKTDDNGQKVPFEMKKGDRVRDQIRRHGNQARGQGIQDPQFGGCPGRARVTINPESFRSQVSTINYPIIWLQNNYSS